MPSAPDKISFSSVSSPIFACRVVTSLVGLRRLSEYPGHALKRLIALLLDLVWMHVETLRLTCPNEKIFDSLADARRRLALWRYDYNHVRPHSSLDRKTPAESLRALEQSESSAPGELT